MKFKIAELTADELYKGETMDLAERFYSSAFAGKFNKENFLNYWTNILMSGQGIILGLKVDEKLEGCLLGVSGNDIDTGTYIATIKHWFVEEDARGYGIFLIKRFEKWSNRRGCKKINASCLLQFFDLMHKKIYKRLGYVPTAIHFEKELKNVKS